MFSGSHQPKTINFSIIFEYNYFELSWARNLFKFILSLSHKLNSKKNKELKPRTTFMSKHVRTSVAATHFGVCERTIRDWATAGKLSYTTTPGGHRRIDISGARRQEQATEAKRDVCSVVRPCLLSPEFAVKQMTRKRGQGGEWKRRINRSTVRRMLLWGHYQFRMRLLAKAKQWGKTVVVVGEGYTSKTCGMATPKNWAAIRHSSAVRADSRPIGT